MCVFSLYLHWFSEYILFSTLCDCMGIVFNDVCSSTVFTEEMFWPAISMKIMFWGFTNWSTERLVGLNIVADICRHQMLTTIMMEDHQSWNVCHFHFSFMFWRREYFFSYFFWLHRPARPPNMMECFINNVETYFYNYWDLCTSHQPSDDTRMTLIPPSAPPPIKLCCTYVSDFTNLLFQCPVFVT